jgi:predicted exporter
LPRQQRRGCRPAEDRDFLWRNRYLLSSAVLPERFSVAGLRQALENDLQLLGSPAGMLVKRVLLQRSQRRIAPPLGTA